MQKTLISFVIPCYNEEEVLPLLAQGLTATADRLSGQYDVEFVMIDDGSRDKTWDRICAFAKTDRRVRGIMLSRNFGHQAALTCGYDLANGEAIISLDADLQDPPEVIAEMLDQWKSGADVVYAIRKSREGESLFKLYTAKGFYWFINAMGASHVRNEAGDFRLMSRKSLDALNKLREKHRFIRGMVGWVGFRTAEVHYERKPRAAGQTKYPFRKMLLFAIDATVSFSSFPLRFAYILAAALSMLFFSYLLYAVVLHLFYGVAMIPGWSSLILSIIAFGAINLVCLGIMGEYVGRIYEQSKQRPLYFVSDQTPRSDEPTV